MQEINRVMAGLRLLQWSPNQAAAKDEPQPAAAQAARDVLLLSSAVAGVAQSVLALKTTRSNQEYVRDLYRDLLGREPDPAGFADHVGRLQAGTSRETIRQAFLGSYEFQHREMVNALYHGLLGRTPDPDGYRHFMDRFAAGASFEEVEQEIKASPEYQARHPQPQPAAPANPLDGLSEAQLRELGATDHQAFLEALRPAAEEAERLYGVPAAITLAQAALETGWGQSIIDGYNLFGVKGAGPAGSIRLPTHEYLDGRYVAVEDDFARYHSFTEAIMQRGNLFRNGHYDQAMARYAADHDPYAFGYDITGTYATDPTYGDQLAAIMRQFDLA